MGAAAIAGEERKGTIGLLMANPKSRTSVLALEDAALMVLSVLGDGGHVGVCGGSRRATLDIDVGDLDVFAINVHMLAIVLFNGMLALAIGAATGNRGAALGVTIAVLVVGFLGTGLLPMLEWGEDWVKIFPWYYFAGSEPLYNGVDWEHIAILLGASALFAVAAVVGVNRRDFKGQSVGVTMIDRLRAIPATKKLADASRVARASRRSGSRRPPSTSSCCCWYAPTCSSSGRSWAGSAPPSRRRPSRSSTSFPRVWESSSSSSAEEISRRPRDSSRSSRSA